MCGAVRKRRSPGCTRQSCADKYPGLPDAIKCCEMGFDTGDIAKFRCCRKHVKLGEGSRHARQSEALRRPRDLPDLSGMQASGESIATARRSSSIRSSKSCCESVGGNLWFMMAPKQLREEFWRLQHHRQYRWRRERAVEHLL
jgi:hypothetical protein